MSDEAKSLRESILTADDLTKVTVEVPEWGVTVTVRVMTGEERDNWEAQLYARRTADKAANLLNLRARLACVVCIDGEGKRIFSDADADLLGKKSARALDRVFEAASRVNGLREQDVEDLTKNSPSGTSGASPTA